MERIKYLLMAIGVLAILNVMQGGKTKIEGDKIHIDIVTIVENQNIENTGSPRKITDILHVSNKK